jgi:GntR family transcriptional regulator
MFVRIQRGTSVPISRQIDAQIRAQIVAGALPAGHQLPSVRQLARELAVNVNTVFRVYGRLSSDGLIELRHGDGTYVSQRRKSAVTAQLTKRRHEFAQELDALVRRALMLGISAAELPDCLSESVQRVQQDVSFAEAISPTKETLS